LACKQSFEMLASFRKSCPGGETCLTQYFAFVGRVAEFESDLVDLAIA